MLQAFPAPWESPVAGHGRRRPPPKSPSSEAATSETSSQRVTRSRSRRRTSPKREPPAPPESNGKAQRTKLVAPLNTVYAGMPAFISPVADRARPRLEPSLDSCDPAKGTAIKKIVGVLALVALACALAAALGGALAGQPAHALAPPSCHWSWQRASCVPSNAHARSCTFGWRAGACRAI